MRYLLFVLLTFLAACDIAPELGSTVEPSPAPSWESEHHGMRPLYMVGMGDSLALAGHDEADLGGIIGRLVDWGLAQSPPVMLWFQGRGPVKNHIAPAANVQWNEAFGGLEIEQLEASILNRLDQAKVPTGFPTFGSSAMSIARKIDGFIWMGGANNANNPAQTAAQINAADLHALRTIRSALDPRSPDCRIFVVGGLTDWGDSAAHAKLVDVNAARAATVYDVFDAEHPTNPLVRMDWYTLAGPWNVGEWDDLVHFKAVVFDRIVNTPVTGMIAKFGPTLTAMAETGSTMGTISPAIKNAHVNHLLNKAARTPAVTHYRHVYADAGLTVPLTNVTAPGYAALAKTNNTTLYPSISSGRAQTNGVDWTYASPTGNWPTVYGWKITDNATEGLGTIIAQDTHAPVTVGTSNGPGGTPTGPLSYLAGSDSITYGSADGSGAGGAFSDFAVQSMLNLEFGAVAYTAPVTGYYSYQVGDPRGAGVIAGSRVSATQNSLWGSATGGTAVSIADLALTQQVTGTFLALHDAVSSGHLILAAPRPSTVGAGGTIFAGQLYASLTD